MPDQLPVLDPRPLLDLLEMGAGPELVQELIGLLKEDVPPRIIALGTAAGGCQAETVVHEAHQMKGALSNLGLQRFADQAARIEDLARAGAWEEAKDLIEGLPAAYEEAMAALSKAFPAS